MTVSGVRLGDSSSDYAHSPRSVVQHDRPPTAIKVGGKGAKELWKSKRARVIQTARRIRTQRVAIHAAKRSWEICYLTARTQHVIRDIMVLYQRIAPSQFSCDREIRYSRKLGRVRKGTRCVAQASHRRNNNILTQRARI